MWQSCRASKIAPALMGALVLVALIRKGEMRSTTPAVIFGTHVSEAMKEGFIALSAILGALGSFFAGSTTVSNLTFGSVQAVRSQRDTNLQHILASAYTADCWVL
jgi:L-lactate permease